MTFRTVDGQTITTDDIETRLLGVEREPDQTVVVTLERLPDSDTIENQKCRFSGEEAARVWDWVNVNAKDVT